MERRPVPTAEEAQRATARIEALMDAAPGTPEGDELNLLATLVDAWDQERWRFFAKHRMISVRWARIHFAPTVVAKFRMNFATCSIYRNRHSLNSGKTALILFEWRHTEQERR